MQTYWQLLISSFGNYANYLSSELTNLHWGNYIYWLLGISVAVFALEVIAPWRQNQPKVRKDFWIDGFYMFFNFFIFGLIGYVAVSTVVESAFNDLLAAFGAENLVAVEVNAWPAWAKLLTMFVVRDFIQWNIHRLLHRFDWLWQFHKVHHSILEMGFAGHLRYHWMENVIYRTLEYIPLAMIGFGVQDFILVHLIALTIGHLNHANFTVPLGPLKYIFNNAKMHIWHHVRDMPEGFRYGINFGISLACWDYLFKTAHIPESGRDITLGFPGDDNFPRGFIGQETYGFKRPKA